MFGISRNKSSGTNGFSSAFFKGNCNTLGSLVTTAVQEFFYNGKMLSQVNAANLVIIPKVPNQIQLETLDQCPVVMCVFKCISKILCERLKSLLLELIGTSHNVFI